MSKKHLQLDAHIITPLQWWYEEQRGIYVLALKEGNNYATEVFIKWSALRAALKRKDRK